MEKLILLSRFLFLGFLISACTPLDVDFTKLVATKQGTLECTKDTGSFGIIVPYWVETEDEIRLELRNGEAATWTLYGNFGEKVLEGAEVKLSIADVGEVKGVMEGVNLCGVVEYQEFKMQVIKALEAPKLAINSGAAYTNKLNVQLDHDVVGAQAIFIAEDNNCSQGEWINASSSSSKTLNFRNSKNNIFAKFKNRVRESSCVQASIVHDELPPIPSVSGIPDEISNTRSISVRGNAVDNISGVARVLCSLNRTEFVDCSSAITMNTVQGTNTVDVYAIDNATNASEFIRTSFEVDWTAPSIQITSGPDQWTNDPIAKFEIQTDGSYKIECKWNSGDYTECNQKPEFTATVDGSQLLMAKATDSAGNTSTIASYTFNLDTTGPLLKVINQPLPISPETFAEFQFTATDIGIGKIGNYGCILDASPINCGSKLLIEKLENGDHSLQVRVSDSLGNWSEYKNIDWKVDDGIVNQEVLVGEAIKRVDIAIVIDHSSSMKREQREMANRFGDFTDSLSQLDWQMGIITTDAKNKSGFGAGELQSFTSHLPEEEDVFILKSDDNNKKNLFEATIQRKERGNDTEEGIRSLWQMLDTENAKELFRPESHFATIIISDEDEKSRGRALKNENKPEWLMNKIKNKWDGRKSFSAHSIVFKSDDSRCARRGGKYEGKTYEKLSNLTGGIIGSICEDDFTAQLQDIGGKIQQTAYAIDLECVPEDRNNDGEGDVKLSMQPSTGDVELILEGKKVFLNPYPDEGTKVSLVYHCPK
ncbi:MAG: hypothetical protein AB8E15_10090 [Bdellovibrionales bacterium]